MEVMMDLDLTIPYHIDQVEFTGTFGAHQCKSQTVDVDFKAWRQPVTTKFFCTHCQKHSTVVKRPIITKRLCEGIVSGSIDTPLFSRGVPRTTREGHSDCRSAGSRIRGQLGIQTLHSKDPNAARQDHHGKPWMKRPQELLTTMETGGSLSKGKDWGDLAGRIGFGSKVVAGGNQGAK